jgi:hypothetical protein
MGWSLLTKRGEVLGVTKLHLKNVSILCKWIWMLENENCLWQDLVKAKYYLTNALLLNVNQVTFPFLFGLVYIKDTFWSFCNELLVMVRKIVFGRIAKCYPRLYNLCCSHNITVNIFITRGLSCLKFRRFLREENQEMWVKLEEVCS